MNEEHFAKVKALGDEAKAIKAEVTAEIACAALRTTYRQLPQLQVSEVARTFNELCGVARKQAA